MRIVEISVKELFGIKTFNYNVKLNNDKRITIIHGPNGSGKTVLFKMIDGLFNRHYFVFWRYPFKEFIVTFDNGENIKVKREYDKERQFQYPEIIYSKGPVSLKLEISGENLRRGFTYSARHRVPSDEYIKLLRFFSGERHTLEGYKSYDEIIAIFGEDLLSEQIIEPKWLRLLQEKLKVNFINTNRLLINRSDSELSRRQGETWVNAITENSKDLSTRIQEKILEADTKAKTLDRTFPSRVISNVVSGKKRGANYEAIREELNKLEIHRQRLAEAGLLEPGTPESEFQIPKEIVNSQQERTLRSVLNLYIADTKEKLAVYQQLASKIELFKDIIQDMLKYKNLHISKNGFQLQSQAGLPIPLAELSSGEQHLLVVIYNLLFRPFEKVDELVLIDEPEISLHISWQKRFIDDLLRINKLSTFDVIIATHSPSIINGRLDLMVPIQGISGDEY